MGIFTFELTVFLGEAQFGSTSSAISNRAASSLPMSFQWSSERMLKRTVRGFGLEKPPGRVPFEKDHVFSAMTGSSRKDSGT